MKKIIELKNVYKKAGQKTILNDVSFEISTGECIALLGKNGAGKSTVIKSILKWIDVNKGEIDVHIKKEDIGILDQETKMPEDASVQNLIDFFMKSFPNSMSLKKIKTMLKFKEKDYLKMAKKFSGGQQRFFDFVLTLVGQPKLLILDEPTSGMDINIREDFWKIIEKLKKEGITILFTTHFLEEVDNCDRIILLEEGKVIENDTPFNIRAKNKRKEIKINKDTTNSKEFIKFMKQKDIESLQENGLYTFIFDSNKTNSICKKLVEFKVDMEDVEISNSSLLKTLLNNGKGDGRHE